MSTTVQGDNFDSNTPPQEEQPNPQETNIPSQGVRGTSITDEEEVHSSIEGGNKDVNDDLDDQSESEEVKAELDPSYDPNYPPLVKWTRDHPKTKSLVNRLQEFSRDLK